MKFKVLLFFFIIWFFRGFIVEYFLGMPANSMASTDPALMKLLLEGSIIILFISSIKKIKLVKFHLLLFIPVVGYLIVSLISSKLNGYPLLNGIKFSRYLIYSLFIYHIGKSIYLDSNRLNKIINIILYLMIFQILISLFNIVFYGPLENRIGTMILQSGELGTIFPLTALAFGVSYYYNISASKKTIVFTWLFLLVGLSTGKRAVLFVFPFAYLFFNYVIQKLYKNNFKHSIKNIYKSVLIIILFTPLLLIYTNNVTTSYGSGKNKASITQIFNFVKTYTMGETKNSIDGDTYTRGRISTTLKVISSFIVNPLEKPFGYGPMILYDKKVTGYGSGFTLMKIFYGIVGWSRDFFSIGIFGVLFIIWFMILLFNRLRVLITFRSKLDPRINFIIMGCYLASFVLAFDYFLYSAVTYVSGFPLFIISFGLGIAENWIRKFNKKIN